MNNNIKLLGGIGSILVVIGFIPSLTFTILLGMILLLIAYYYAANEVNEKNIFKEALISFILTTVSVFSILLISIFIIVYFGIKLFEILSIDMIDNIQLISSMGFGIFFLIISIFVLWVIFIISAYKLKKADELLSLKTGENLFKISGIIIFIGSFLNIILIGIILTIAGYIIKSIAFFNLKEKEA
ncbi:MAG: DUF996 domain-containing protein [Brevinematia bacterium]